MRKEELTIKIVERLIGVFGDETAPDIRRIIDDIVCDYDVTSRITAVAPLNNMGEMMMLFIASKKNRGVKQKYAKKLHVKSQKGAIGHTKEC